MQRRIIWFLVVLLIAGFAIGAWLILPRIIGEVSYPLAYDNLIIKYSSERQLDPFLVAAVIYSESHFHPTAVSPVGARGLMQLTPPTAQGIATRLGIKNYQVSDLFDPETNINFGTFHLQGLAGRYNSNIDGMLAGYNGGGGVGDRYVAGQGGIPLETQIYVVNVKAAMQKYHDLYSDRLSPTKIILASFTSTSTGVAAPTITTSSQQSLSNRIITSIVSFLQQ